MLSTWLISFQCKLYATPIELHIKRSLSMRGFYLSSPFVFYSFALTDNPCFNNCQHAAQTLVPSSKQKLELDTKITLYPTNTLSKSL